MEDEVIVMNCSPKLCVLIKIEEDLCDTRVSNYISAFLNKPFGEIKSKYRNM